MTERIEVPQGTRVLEMPDGSTARGDGSGLVIVDDRQASMIRAHGSEGAKIIGTRISGFDKGPWHDCIKCGRTFMSEGEECPRCRGEIVPEPDHAPTPRPRSSLQWRACAALECPRDCLAPETHCWKHRDSSEAV